MEPEQSTVSLVCAYVPPLLTYLIPSIFVVATIFVPKGALRTLDRLKKSDGSKASIETMVRATQQAELEKISQLVKNCAESECTYLLTKVQAAIDYAIGRHDWYEDQRSNMFKAIIAIAGVAFTAMGFYANLNENLTAIENAAISGSVAVTFFSVLCAIYLYNKELDQDRTYRLVSDIRFWYFRYNLPQRAENVKKSEYLTMRARAVLAERERFFSRISDLSSLSKLVREDLEQIFILQVLQRYKSESLARLRWLLSYTIAFLAAEITLAFSFSSI